MIKALPSTSFVSFDVPRLARSEIIWSNQEIASDMDIGSYDYCLPLKGDSEAAFTNDTKTYLAERYGGRGISKNGGGVRCGLINEVQVKGIGRNPLAGRTSSFWHSHGGVTLEEAVREAIWGEVCNIALPYGGSRVYGIISTGTQTTYHLEGNDRQLPRALILREATLRPAHFMRAVYFEPSAEVKEKYCSDVDRTKLAVREISAAFGSVFGNTTGAGDDVSQINNGILEMVRRFGSQIAAARVKKISHGSLSCSNISMDGRYVDYGTISTILDYGRIIVARGNPDLWREQTALIPTLTNFVFYLHKYLPENVAKEIVPVEQVLQTYHQHFVGRLMAEHLKLTGIPQRQLVHVPRPLLINLHLCIMRIIQAGNREPFKMPQMPEKTGEFHLSSIFRSACLCRTSQEMEERIRPLLSNDILRSEFIKYFYEAREQYLASFPSAGRASALLFSTLNCLRLNDALPELCRPNFERTVLKIIKDGDEASSYAKLVSTLRNKAKTLLSDPTDLGISFDWYCGSKIWVSESRIASPDGSPLSIDGFLSTLNSRSFSAEEKSMLSSLCQ